MKMTNKQKEFAALAPPRNKITKADRIVGATGKPTIMDNAHLKCMVVVWQHLVSQ